MRTALLLGAAAMSLMVGCASDHHHTRYTRHEYRERPVVIEEHSTPVIVEQDGTRTYVREYDYNPRPQYQYRGKHPDALGWNDPYWNR
jgi:hypothetical protein